MRENIIVIGGGVAGQSLVKDIQVSLPKTKIIGVLDDNVKEGTVIGKDVKVIGNIDSLKNIFDQYKLNKIIIAMPSERGKLVRKIVLLVGDHNEIDICILPRVSEILATIKASYTDVRLIEPVDIIGEEIVKKDQEKVNKVFKNEVILVTGGGGSIGSELSKQIFLLKPKKLIIIDMSEKNLFWVDLALKQLNKLNNTTEIEVILGSVNNLPLISRIFKENKITSVFHAAAYKHVPLLESNIYEAINNNSVSTYNLSKLAYESGVKKFILVSTDKAVKPVNNMGRSKRLSEKIITYFDAKDAKTIYSAVRFGNVFNSSGSAVEIFLHQIEKEKKVTVTSEEMTRFFMTIPEAVHLILQAWYLAKESNFYMVEMGDAINILELAKCLVVIKKQKLSTFNIEIIGTRPGEKIHEELFNGSEESRTRTEHKRIYKVKNTGKDEGFIQKFSDLLAYLKIDDVMSHSSKSSEKLSKLLKGLT